jgi:hypothetical protein
MSDPESIVLGEECLAKLDNYILVLKKAGTKGVFEVSILSPLLTWLKRRDLKKAEKLAVEVRRSLESFRISLGKDEAFPFSTMDFSESTKTTDYFLGKYGDLMVQDLINGNIEMAKNAKVAIQSLMGR